MRRLGIIIAFTCLLVTGLFAGIYFYWHRQEMQHGKAAPLTQLYGADGWTADYLAAEPRRCVTEVRERLAALVAEQPTVLEKIDLIVAHMLREVQPYVGIPDAVAEKMTGLEIYRGMLTGEVAVGGDNLTHAYVGVANALGIPTRLVEVADHRFAESWIDEADKWAFVDVSARKAYVLGPEAVPLDAIELFVKLQQGAEEELEVSLFQGGEMVRVPYSVHCGLEQLRLVPEAVLCYPRAQHLYGSTIRRLGYDLLSPKLVYSLDDSR
jgi:hypothetical protein